MQPTEFGAAVQLGKYLARVEQTFAVKGAFQALLLIEIDLAEHRWHQIALLDTDAMLAGQNTADLDAEFEDLGAELLGLFELAGLVGIVKDQRVQVAVTGMEHVGD